MGPGEHWKAAGDRVADRGLDAAVEHGSVRRGDAGRGPAGLQPAQLLMRPRLLALAVTILGCSCAQPGGGRIDPVLAAMAPADTILLSGIRMSEVRSTPLYTRMISQQRLSELDDFARQTNFDPRKDVTELLLASNGVDNLMLARGNFKIQTPAGMKKSIYKGATLFGKADGAFAI